MKPQLPSLALRETRVRLLAWSYTDALTAGTLDGTGQDSHGSRLNLHDVLWTQGSYRELQTAIHGERWFRRTYLERKLHDQPSGSDDLRRVTGRMPANIYVPAEISEAAGYLPSLAKVYAMPRREHIRRYARVG